MKTTSVKRGHKPCSHKGCGDTWRELSFVGRRLMSITCYMGKHPQGEQLKFQWKAVA